MIKSEMVGRVYAKFSSIPVKSKVGGWEEATHVTVGINGMERVDYTLIARDMESCLHKLKAFDANWKFGCGISLLEIQTNEFADMYGILLTSAACLLSRHFEVIAVRNPLAEYKEAVPPVLLSGLPGVASPVNLKLYRPHFTGVSKEVSFTVCVAFLKDANHYSTGDIIPGSHVGALHAPKGQFCSCGKAAVGKCNRCDGGTCGRHCDEDFEPVQLCSDCIESAVANALHEESFNRSVDGENCDCEEPATHRCTRCTEPSCDLCGEQGMCGYCAHMCLKDD